MNSSLKLAAILVAATTATASAQGRGKNTNGVPPGLRPPAGMCRVWIDGVPAGRQPAITDCATAQAQLRPNSRIIYGDGTRALRTYTRKRQLTNGSWVLERYRRDASGNISLLSTTPLGTANVTKAQVKAEKKQLKAERKAEKKEMKAERRGDDNVIGGAKHEGKGNKGKHEKEDRDEDNR